MGKGRKISKKIIGKIQSLYNRGDTVANISRTTGVPYSTVYGYTRIIDGGFQSPYEYQEHLTKEQGFNSYYEYQEHLARKRGFGSLQEYKGHLAKEQGFESRYEYEQHLAKEQGFNSYYEYQEHLARKRTERSKNRELSDLIKSRLEYLGKNLAWLSVEAKVPRSSISEYAKGKNLPNEQTLSRILKILRVSQKSLEDLIKD